MATTRDTLPRFYMLHAAVLPVTMILLIGIHIALIRLQGVTEFSLSRTRRPGRRKSTSTSSRTTSTPSSSSVSCLMILLSVLATILPATMGPKADPLTTPEVIKPEWFFYVAFRWLKLFSGTLRPAQHGPHRLHDVRLAVHRRLDSPPHPIPGSQRLDRHRGRVFAMVVLTVWEAASWPTDVVVSAGDAFLLMTLNQNRHGHRRTQGVVVPPVAGLRAVDGGRRVGRKPGLGGAARRRARQSSSACVDCHGQTTPAIVDHWKGSKHARAEASAAVECHQADEQDADGFDHYGATRSPRWSRRATARAATRSGRRGVLEQPPRQGRQHPRVARQLPGRNGRGLAGALQPAFADARARRCGQVNGHGECLPRLPAMPREQGRPWATTAAITVDDLEPDADGIPTNLDAVARIVKTEDGRPSLSPGNSWPNTGIGRSQPGRLARLVLGLSQSPRLLAPTCPSAGELRQVPPRPGSPAEGDLRGVQARRGLPRPQGPHEPRRRQDWVLGEDYSQAPTCATCHMSGHSRNGGKRHARPG